MGVRLRALRKQRGLTLQDLSRQTQLSIAHLSNIERDSASPTIANLHLVCAALDITLNDLLAADKDAAENGSYVVPQQARPAIFDQEGLSYSSLTLGDSSLKATAMSLCSHEWVHFSAHDHDELGIMSSGSMEMKVGDATHVLHPGDSIFIRQGTMHSARLCGEGESVSYWIKSGA
ncbi:MAG: XRE family transcriptional regulator [Coriobacteriia bacterium]|nr:XRE family transcriptional regulator [Coriobacteriia bacterium]